MAPERIGAPSDVDARADIYGVGALIFFLRRRAAAVRRRPTRPTLLRAGARRRRRRGSPTSCPACPPRSTISSRAASRRRRSSDPAPSRDIVVGAGVAASAAVDARRRARVVGAVAAKRPALKRAERRRLGQHVRIELPLEPRDLVLQQQLAPLQSPQLQFVVRRILAPVARSRRRDRDARACSATSRCCNATRPGRRCCRPTCVVVAVQSVPTAAASSTSGRRAPITAGEPDAGQDQHDARRRDTARASRPGTATRARCRTPASGARTGPATLAPTSSTPRFQKRYASTDENSANGDQRREVGPRPCDVVAQRHLAEPQRQHAQVADDRDDQQERHHVEPGGPPAQARSCRPTTSPSTG